MYVNILKLFLSFANEFFSYLFVESSMKCCCSNSDHSSYIHIQSLLYVTKIITRRTTELSTGLTHQYYQSTSCYNSSQNFPEKYFSNFSTESRKWRRLADTALNSLRGCARGRRGSGRPRRCCNNRWGFSRSFLSSFSS